MRDAGAARLDQCAQRGASFSDGNDRFDLRAKAMAAKLVSILAVLPSLASRGLAPGKVCLRLVPPPAARSSEWAESRGSGDGVEHSAVVLVVVVTSLGVLVIKNR